MLSGADTLVEGFRLDVPHAGKLFCEKLLDLLCTILPDEHMTGAVLSQSHHDS